MLPKICRNEEYCGNCAEAHERNSCTQIRWVQWFGVRLFVKYAWE